MTDPKNETLAALGELELAVREAKRAVAREGFDLSHRGHASRIDLANRLSTSLSRRFAEALHAVNGMAIGHDLVDPDYADIVASVIADACADEYEPAVERQRSLAAAEARETAFGRRLAA
ncbi:hypothetical protein [Aureimonas leprariae]|uniref:Uncharacterized protein n=1 Tax=Plantimonas leprariae TaxID=2615207 RepID=A0A7V7U0I5_9HYPH|nr:hypothetical protein [Aureimonas leprariae]KAB0680391.1 hypothetical protein F6X38_09500 [Aureimonas leprariae]